MAVSFKGSHFPTEVILMGVRWYLAYPLSTRHIEELMLERGVTVDHSTVNRWVITYSPQLEEAFYRRKRPVWVSWRLDADGILLKPVAVVERAKAREKLLKVMDRVHAKQRPSKKSPQEDEEAIAREVQAFRKQHAKRSL